MTGATGQDGSYLCERLFAEGAKVHAVVEDAAGAASLPWLAGAQVHQQDLRDAPGVHTLVAAVRPAEVYNLAGISSVAASWNRPVRTAEVNAMTVVALLDAVRAQGEQQGVPVRFVQASSAEIFGEPVSAPQDEATPVAPTNPYGAAKAYAHHMVGVYRTLGVHACSVILYNHESPRRPTEFVTRKITRGAALIAAGHQDHLTLGTLESRRDWGWAPDYVDGMIRAVRHHKPMDVVLATGITHSIADFVEAALAAAGVGGGLDRVRLDPQFARPTDTTEQRGDATLARATLGWAPTVGFGELVARMVRHDASQLGPRAIPLSQN